MKIPKVIKKIGGKFDIRKQPDPEEARKFIDGCSRRYINIGILTRDFYTKIAKTIGDSDLLEYAKEIEQAIYKKDNVRFETYKNLFTTRMKELGLMKTVKGLSFWQFGKAMRRLHKAKKKIDKLKKQGKIKIPEG